MKAQLLFKGFILLSLLFPLTLFSQGGTSLTSPGTSITLPFSAAGTTIGSGNNVDDPDPTVIPASAQDNGPDWVYRTCATSTAPVYITVNFTPGGASTPVLPVINIYYDNGGTWLLLQTGSVTGDVDQTVGLPFVPSFTGMCYYIVVEGPNAAGYNYNINVTTTALPTQTLTTQPGCTNMGFDNGTTSGWTGNWGHSITTGAVGAQTPVYTPIYGTMNAGHHTVTTGGADPYTGAFPQVCPLIPSNTNSIMLGDGPNASYGGAQIMQKFNVTAANALFTYYYAAVIQDAGVGAGVHQNWEQPYFKIEALNCSGAPITCGNLLVTGGPGIPGFTQIGSTGVYYKDWSPIMLDLTPYIGSCVTIKFTVGDCTLGAHFSYVYLDATCGPLQIVAPPSVCQYSSTTLTAPSGASSYSWVNTASPGTVLSTSNPFVFAPTVTGTATYQCTMTNVAGCSSTVTTTVTVDPSPQISVTNPAPVCAPGTVDITSGSVVTITSGTGTVSYYSDAACTVPIAAPGAITTSGTYYIKILNANGCYDVRPVTVVVNPTPTVNVSTADQTICAGQSVNLSSTVTPAGVNTPLTFTNTTDYNITDASVTATVSPITVSGVFPQTAGVLPIVSLQINIAHTYDDDLTIRLQCPNGSVIELSSQNGLDGNNYTNTVFVPTGSTSITAGTAPFTGNFTPEQAFNLLNSCTVNGTWSLLVYDLASGDVGTILDWSITFNSYVPPTFAWSPTTNMTNSTTLSPTVTPTVTTTYTLTGTSGVGGCSATDPVTITVNPLPTATISGTTTVCQNAAAPNITFTGANGTAPYTFTYKINGGANQTVSSGAGSTATVSAPTSTVGTFTYTLVSVSSSGCPNPQTGSAIVTVNPLPTATISGTTTVCQNGTAPTITFTGANATAAYTFTYNINGGANQTVSSGAGSTATATAPTSAAGTFTYNLVSVSSANSCSQNQTGSAVVTVTPLPTATISGTATVCQNAAAPNIIFTGTNGTAPYTFTYNINGGANQTVSSGAGSTATVSAPTSAAGTFTYNLVSVSSANSCSQTQTGSAVVTVDPLPTATISGTTTVCQNDPAPTITFTGANGTAPYTFTYNINGGANQTVSSGAGSTATVTSPTATVGTFTYNLISVSSANTCSQTQTGSAVVTVNPLPTATISGTTTVCQNAAAPNITFTGANGTAPYTFTYNINGGANQTVSSGAGSTATVSAPTSATGTFTYNLVSVSSANSCSQTQTGSAVVTVNPLPTATISGTTTVCQNDPAPTITFTGANGTAPYTFTYNINGGASQTVSSGAGSTATVSAPTSATGTFTYNLVSVSIASGCPNPQTGSAVVTVNPLPTATISGTATVCQNDPAPTITFTGANGTAPYTFTYNINGGANLTVSSGAGSTATVSAPTATAGTFTYNLVNVSNPGGCSQTQTGSAIVTVNLLPTATISGTATVCQNDAAPNITFTGANGIAPYTFTYTINGGPNQTVSSGGGSTATVSVPTTTSGTFTYNLVSVSNGSGCSQTQTGNAIVTVNPLPTATISGTATVCQNDPAATITFTGANGTVPYTFTYNINGGANLTVSSGAGSTATVSVPTATAGTFTYNLVSVSNPGGCSQTQTGSAVVTVNLLPTATISGTVTVCQNDPAQTITFTGVNGIAPYTFTYTINGGANQSVSSGAGSTATVSAPTTTAGTFTYNLVSVSNANGCSQTQTGSSIVTVNPLPTATVSGTTTVCQNDPSATITFTGANGAAPYTFTYTLNGGANQTVSSGAGNTATVTVSTSTAGTFTYNLVSVASGTCSQNQTGTATVTVNPQPTATIAGTISVCQNTGNQTVTFTGANGTAPYTFTYSLNGGANQTISSGAGNTATISVSSATAGTFAYTLVSVSEALGCSQLQSGTATVVIDPAPTATITGTTSLCQNSTAPDITFTGANGTAPYTFTYSLNGGANQTIVSDAAGIATISVVTSTPGIFSYDLINVTSAIGCSQAQTGNATVTILATPSATVSGSVDVCQNDPDPVVTFTGNNDAPSYTFTYTLNGGANQTLSSGAASSTATLNAPTSTAGTFVYNLITVQSNNTCTQTVNQTVTIVVNPTPTAAISGATTICDGSSATLTVTGTANATVTYSDGTTTGTVVLDASGSGTITTGALSATTTYTLQSVQSAAPASCTATLSSSITVTVNPIPVADAVSDIAVCAGVTVNIPAFVSTPGGASFGWSNTTPSIGLGATGIGNIPSFTGTNPGTAASVGTVTYAPSLNGCIGAAQTFTITVYPPPVANAGTDDSGCQNTGVISIGSPADPNNSYSWTPVTGLSSATSSDPTVSTTTVGTTNYTLTVTSAQGCTAADNVTVTVNGIPQVSIAPGAASGCAPVSVTFTANAPTSVNCVWTIDGIGTVTGCGSVTETFYEPGQYGASIVVTDANGCTNTAATTSPVLVYPEVIAAFGADAISHSTLDPTFHFFNESINAINYQWTFGDGTSSSVFSPTHTYGESDEEAVYHVMLVASNNFCVDTAFLTVSTTPELIFYVPNTFTPDGDENNNVFFPVFTAGFDRQSYTLLIFDRWGEIIFESHDIDVGWDGTYHDMMCKEDVYIWKIQIKEKAVDKHHEYHGHVTLLK